ncbi:hypothetical protein QJS04_geneDACA002333 [Acorus gramineus]|uniref:Secreted protein n=1 Tax=Acorus gramineus TaxID=55184 RepID=A0AAV8ZZ77_ACOGR|nr:hypothetical protein QJS04_geneDACA024557 [Acorus gramineus]KAK1261200.1 hypothetical protein QJS04_geneDACA002333 [Acorus gramineus]
MLSTPLFLLVPCLNGVERRGMHTYIGGGKPGYNRKPWAVGGWFLKKQSGWFLQLIKIFFVKKIKVLKIKLSVNAMRTAKHKCHGTHYPTLSGCMRV